MNEYEQEPMEIIDINWSNDGTMIAAGFEKSLVLLDMRKILSTSVEDLVMQSQQDTNLGGTQKNHSSVKNIKGQGQKSSSQLPEQKHGSNHT